MTKRKYRLMHGAVMVCSATRVVTCRELVPNSFAWILALSLTSVIAAICGGLESLVGYGASLDAKNEWVAELIRSDDASVQQPSGRRSKHHSQRNASGLGCKTGNTLSRRESSAISLL